MAKRLLDILLSAFGLLIAAPIILPVCVLIWLQDFHNPFYIAPRVGKDGKEFMMVKLRSMVVGADKTGVCSTAADDKRITKVGHFVRRWKLDEVPQLWNVLKGDMSMVGPRPNVRSEVALYTQEESELLKVSPGVTDIASIVFADEAEILRNSEDPDSVYNRLIRPWKASFGLTYVRHSSIGLYLHLLVLTAMALVRRRAALDSLANLLISLGCDTKLAMVARRKDPLAIPLASSNCLEA